MKNQSKDHKPMLGGINEWCECDNCHKWLKLPDEVDETGGITIPLTRHRDSKNNWLCDDCWNKLEAGLG